MVHENTINLIPAFILLLIGYISNVPTWLQILGIVGGLTYGLINIIIAIRKEIRETKKNRNQNNSA